MKKILYVATVVKTHIMEFHIPMLKALQDGGWNTSVVARNDYVNPEECNIPYCNNYYNVEFSRNPFGSQNVRAYKELKELIENNEYDVVHCHTPVGGVLTRLAARNARKRGTKVVYTAHGFHFYKGGSRISWLVYYPIEKICAKFTDLLITINQEDYALAKRKMHAKRVEYIPGVGIDVDKFANYKVDIYEKRKKFGIPETAIVLLSVGELNANKNHESVIKAVSKLEDKNIHYVIAGDGELNEYLRNLVNELNLSENVHLIGYRKDVPELYKMADYFIHPSIREGLPVALMEAMASGLKCIATRNRGSEDLKETVDSLYLYDDTSSSGAERILKRVLSDNTRRESNVSDTMKKTYDVGNICKKILKLYDEL